jgi:hypothetical protein
MTTTQGPEQEARPPCNCGPCQREAAAKAGPIPYLRRQVAELAFDALDESQRSRGLEPCHTGSDADAIAAADAQYGGVCVDEVTQQRVDDDRCGDFDDEGRSSNGGFFFMWISTSSSHSVPAVGHKVPATVGSRTVPSGTPLAKGVPTTGGPMTSIARGGFGAKAGVSGGYGSKAGS